MEIRVGTLRREGSAVLVTVTLGNNYSVLEVGLRRSNHEIAPGIASYNSTEYPLPFEILERVLDRVREFARKHRDRIDELLSAK